MHASGWVALVLGFALAMFFMNMLEALDAQSPEPEPFPSAQQDDYLAR
jgi:hypothetical protein